MYGAHACDLGTGKYHTKYLKQQLIKDVFNGFLLDWIILNTLTALYGPIVSGGHLEL